MTLDEEGERPTAILIGKTVKRIERFRDSEVMIEFEDGSRFYADSAAPLEISITVAS